MKNIGEIDTYLKREIQGNLLNWSCPECKSIETQYCLQIIPTGRNDYYPKWVPQIKESCNNCGRYKRFAPQSSILIKRLNDRLRSINLPATGRDFYEK